MSSPRWYFSACSSNQAELTRETAGFQRPMILVNGQFPGPLIEANTGNVLRINVENLMSNWSTTVHFHGIYQKNTTCVPRFGCLRGRSGRSLNPRLQVG